MGSSPTEQMSMEDAQEVKASRIQAGAAMPGTFLVADVTQSAKRRRVKSDIMPTLCCATKLRTVHSSGRELFPREHLSCQGVRAYGSAKDPFALPWLSMLEDGSIDDKSLREMTGNGQHLANLVPLILFLLGHTQPVEPGVAYTSSTE